MIFPTYTYKNRIYLRWILILLILRREVEIWTLCQTNLSVVYAPLLLQRDPVFQNTLIKYTKRYVTPVNPAKNYTSKQTLGIHVQSVHDKLKHNCNFCNSSFQLERSLINHLRAKHSPIIITPQNESSVQWMWFILSWKEESTTTYEKTTWIKEIQMWIL